MIKGVYYKLFGDIIKGSYYIWGIINGSYYIS